MLVGTAEEDEMLVSEPPAVDVAETTSVEEVPDVRLLSMELRSEGSPVAIVYVVEMSDDNVKPPAPDDNGRDSGVGEAVYSGRGQHRV